MIAKHFPMRSLNKSDFAGLVNYITDAQGKTERLGQVRINNCESAEVRDAIFEVLATQYSNTRATGDKTYHLLVSFRPGEKPSAEVLESIEKRLCYGLGFGEHQRISAVHYDTDNLHLHVAINKIHPTRLTMHEPFQDYETLAAICEVLERDFGLESDNHIPKRSVAEGKAADMERHSGAESLVGYIQRGCLSEIRAAQTWADLHQVLAENGLALYVHGNGFVFASSDGTVVKASTVARDFSKPKMEERFGPFEPSQFQNQLRPSRQYQKSPIRLRVNTVELYARYKSEQQSLTTDRQAVIEKMRQQKREEIEAAKRSNRLRRSAIKLVGENRANKKLLYSQASNSLHDEIKKINLRFKKELENVYADYSRKTWADWLKKEALKGSSEALNALRARESAGVKGHFIGGEGQGAGGGRSVIDNITKKGTIIYRVGNSAIRDDGDKLQISREVTREGLTAALQLAMQHYGNRIHVNGNSEFKAKIIRAAVDAQLPITFTDPLLEGRRQQLIKKEQTYGREGNKHIDRGRSGRSACRPDGGGFTDHDNANPGRGKQGHRTDSGALLKPTIHRKPNIGRLGRVPPPQSKDRLRTLSKLGVVRIASGSEVLLPSDVSRDMEQQGAQSNHTLRRGIPGRGLKSEAIAAMNKYIAEREEKRQKIFDIPKHVQYTFTESPLTFVGTRNVDGQQLALLKHDEEVMVMPIDKATAQRLRRVAVGDTVTMTAKGSIATKGRGR